LRKTPIFFAENWRKSQKIVIITGGVPDYQFPNFLQIPFVKQAEALRAEPLKLFASPWTAPKWMKSNNDLIGLGYLLPVTIL
jgi:hypothetical protein